MKINILDQILPTVVTAEDTTRSHWFHLRDDLEPRYSTTAASPPALRDAESRNRQCDTGAFMKSHDLGELKEEASKAAVYSGTRALRFNAATHIKGPINPISMARCTG